MTTKAVNQQSILIYRDDVPVLILQQRFEDKSFFSLQGKRRNQNPFIIKKVKLLLTIRSQCHKNFLPRPEYL